MNCIVNSLSAGSHAARLVNKLDSDLAGRLSTNQRRAGLRLIVPSQDLLARQTLDRG